MNTRVLMLLIAAGLYLRIWSGDAEHQRLAALKRTATGIQQARENKATPPAERRTSQPAAAAADSRRPPRDRDFRGSLGPGADSIALFLSKRGASRQAGEHRSGDQIPLDDLWIFGRCDVPLPPDIAVGRYRAVSTAGEVRIIELTDEELAYHGIAAAAPQREFYSAGEGNCRWYFVRLTPLAARPAMFVNRSGSEQVDARSGAAYLSAAGEWIGAGIGTAWKTAGALVRADVSLSRWWTWQQWLTLRRQWQALRRQAQRWVETVATRNDDEVSR